MEQQLFQREFVQQWPLIVGILGAVAVAVKREFDILKARGHHRGTEERRERSEPKKSKKFGNHTHGDGIPRQGRGR